MASQTARKRYACHDGPRYTASSDHKKRLLNTRTTDDDIRLPRLFTYSAACHRNGVSLSRFRPRIFCNTDKRAFSTTTKRNLKQLRFGASQPSMNVAAETRQPPVLGSIGTAPPLRTREFLTHQITNAVRKRSTLFPSAM